MRERAEDVRRAAVLSMLVGATLLPATPAKADPPLCWFNASTPSITMLSPKIGYYVSAYSQMRCAYDDRIVRTTAHVVLLKNGGLTESAHRSCDGRQRYNCVESIVYYQPCGPHWCRPASWTNFGQGSVIWRQRGDHDKVRTQIAELSSCAQVPKRYTA